jgi:hypothetical protein
MRASGGSGAEPGLECGPQAGPALQTELRLSAYFPANACVNT